MALTLGLSTALSGLLTSQRGLDVVSQNVVNVNTQGYTRKVLNQESVVLAGMGAGVQEGSITRLVDENLLKDIRKQASTTGSLDAQQTYYPQIQNLFGQVGDANSISHKLQDLANAFETMSTDTAQTPQQWSTVQSALDVTNQLGDMTTELQKLRLNADSDLSQSVDSVNQDLQKIYDLNQKIVRNTATSTGTSDLEDQRDNALTDLSQYMDIQYFKRNDGSLTIYTGSGTVLLDNTPKTLTHASTTTTDAWMTQAGGQFNTITVGSEPTDIGPQISNGKMKALLDLRDSTIPNLQAQLDETAYQLKSVINQVSNRGTSYPNVTNAYTGTRTLAKQATITPSATEATATITYNAGAGTIANGGGGYGTLTTTYLNAATATGLTWNTSNGQPIAGMEGQPMLQGTVAGAFTNLAVGSTFTISGSTASANDGTYRVMAKDTTNTDIVVSRVNPVQTISLGSGTDSAVALFDTSGNQISQSTINTIMTTDYTAPPYNAAPYNAAPYNFNTADPEMAAQPTSGPWSISSVAKHLQSWLQVQGAAYTGSTVALDTNGHLAINMGSTTQASLVFHDQTSSAAGAPAGDAVVNFDADGDGQTDETVKGFSNFFGLNDFFVTTQPNSIMDSTIVSSGFTTGNQPRTLRLSDSSGQIGNQVTIKAGATLTDIANSINNMTQTDESGLQSSSSFTFTTPATITVGDASGTLASVNYAGPFPQTVTLNQIAKALTSGTVTAEVVQEQTGARLRIFDNRGVALTTTITGGNISGTQTLGTQLNVQPTHRVRASVIPEGSGFRLRLVQADNTEIYCSADQDVYGKSILTDLGLRHASTRTAGILSVRSDIQSGPQKISRGSMQWNSDLNKYYLSEGDNTTSQQFAAAMSTKINFDSAGTIAQGTFTFSDHATASISLTARQASDSKDKQTYQKTLSDSLHSQYTSQSGVNMDEEVTKMVDFQQAYAASAKVISAIQEMLQTLTDIIK